MARGIISQISPRTKAHHFGITATQRKGIAKLIDYLNNLLKAIDQQHEHDYDKGRPHLNVAYDKLQAFQETKVFKDVEFALAAAGDENDLKSKGWGKVGLKTSHGDDGGGKKKASLKNSGSRGMTLKKPVARREGARRETYARLTPERHTSRRSASKIKRRQSGIPATLRSASAISWIEESQIRERCQPFQRAEGNRGPGPRRSRRLKGKSPAGMTL